MGGSGMEKTWFIPGDHLFPIHSMPGINQPAHEPNDPNVVHLSWAGNVFPFLGL